MILKTLTSGFLAMGMLAAAASFASTDVRYARCGSLVDPINKKIVNDVTVEIFGKYFSQVSETGTIPPGAELIDLSEATCLPGLFELHGNWR